MEILFHECADAWHGTLQEGALKTTLGRALSGCANCRAYEASLDGVVAGYIVYALEPGGAHWHYVFVDEQFRRRGAGTRLFRAMLDDIEVNWTKGAAYSVEAHATSEDGRALVLALGFKEQQDPIYVYTHP